MTCDACVLEAERISFSYDGKTPVLSEVNLCIAPGEMLTILGPNGAGKSTLLNCLVGTLTPQKGRVMLAKSEISEMSPRDIAKLIAYVPQTSIPTYGYQVRTYIAMGRAPHKGLFEQPKAEDLALVDKTIESLGISHIAEKPYTQISGGERQLANVCRALVQQPKIIIFDEPTSALDYGNQVKVLRLVKRLREQGYAIIMTTHNPDHPILLGGRVGILNRQGNFSVGDTKKLMSEDRLSELYDVPLRVIRVDEIDRNVCLPLNL